MHHTHRRYRVRFDRLARLLRDLGHNTDSEMAAFLGVGRTTVLKARHDSIEPSTKFLGAIQDRFPGVPFEELFERVEESDASHPSGPAGPRPAAPPRPSGPPRDERVPA